MLILWKCYDGQDSQQYTVVFEETALNKTSYPIYSAPRPR